MNIGLLGLSFCTGNLGCEALSYAFLEVLDEIANKNDTTIKTTLIEVFPTKWWLSNRLNLKKTKERYLPSTMYEHLQNGCLFYKKINGKFYFENGLGNLDCVFDFTFGDSFTDIYGRERFNSTAALKNEIIKRGVPLVLGSQTIGPFNDPNIEKRARDIILKAQEVYVRDEMSKTYMEKISERTPILTTDVAFALPYNKKTAETQAKIIKIGFNPSGLLWNGGYTQDNQFGLTVDYKEYCRQVLQYLSNHHDEYEVHLILHAYTQDLSVVDNDLIAVNALIKMFNNVVVSPMFENPMEAKSYISNMDVFLGARMHATIGALSSNTPVIPFSYSRKFEGLFTSLNYPYVIHGCSDSTESAVDKTIQWICHANKLNEAVEETKAAVDSKKKFLVTSYAETIRECAYEKRKNKV